MSNLLEPIKEIASDILSREELIRINYNGKDITAIKWVKEVQGSKEAVSEINKYIERLVEKIISEKERSRNLPDEIAEKEILFLLENSKKEKITNINIIEIMQKLRLPAEQIERIMEKLEKAGKVRENE